MINREIEGQMTVGELIDQLAGFNREAVLCFGDVGSLQFRRLKHRGRSLKTGEEIVQVEFDQLVYRDEAGRLIAEDVE